MKKILILSLIVLSFSCKKNIENDHKNIVSTHLNNSLATTQFQYNVYAYKDSIAGANRLRIFSNKGTSLSSDYLVLTIVDYSPITATTYKGSFYNDTLGAEIDYYLNELSEEHQSKLYPVSGNDNTIINITYVDSNRVEGVFSGTVYYPFYSLEPINFIDGKFNATIVK